jgi:hypothetical protein
MAGDLSTYQYVLRLCSRPINVGARSEIKMKMKTHLMLELVAEKK